MCIIFVRDWKVKLMYVRAGKQIRADHSLMDSIELNSIFEKMARLFFLLLFSAL